MEARINISRRAPTFRQIPSSSMARYAPNEEAMTGMASSSDGGFRQRDKNVETFIRMREDDLANLEMKKQVTALKIEQLKMMRQLQDEISVLDKQKTDINQALEDSRAYRRQLLQSMPVVEQMEIVYEAGQASAINYQCIE
ncbi:hypothetical protein GRF29_161g439600 [Pseudopithomyces chartarum]|uniref:Uncharacterized protein n=1 Tax=Pseudopithomyces chartarum TaxID=1892770 RepID=A0AAN6RFM6_9PLEO|nr:hypothetical protein GRF29_161g439600 [Pseudopithomyces chartarum]